MQDFKLPYDAKYTDPSKVSLDAAVETWKIVNAGRAITVEEYDTIRTPSRTTDAYLDCAFVENALFYSDPLL